MTSLKKKQKNKKTKQYSNTINSIQTQTTYSLYLLKLQVPVSYSAGSTFQKLNWFMVSFSEGFSSVNYVPIITAVLLFPELSSNWSKWFPLFLLIRNTLERFLLSEPKTNSCTIGVKWYRQVQRFVECSSIKNCLAERHLFSSSNGYNEAITNTYFMLYRHLGRGKKKFIKRWNSSHFFDFQKFHE